MAETAGTVIKDALTEIVVLGAEASLNEADAQSAIRYLNRMMAALDADGIDLGFTEVTNLASPITVSPGAVQGMIFNLSALLWTQYEDGTPPPGELLLKAERGLETMRAIAVNISPSMYPSTLPRGSGNEGCNTFNRDHFFRDRQDEILAETTGSIGLETDTAEETQ